MSTPTKYSRPLSPFLLYRWQYSMTLSILNRVTGVVLSIGLLPFTYWLVAAASGAEAYAKAQQFFAHPLTTVALVGFSFSFSKSLRTGRISSSVVL